MTGQSVVQPWVSNLSFMQQTVVIELTRGPDGLTKYHMSKYLLRWFRRCFLLSALDKRILTTPYEEGGGSFTGPSYTYHLDLAQSGPYIKAGSYTASVGARKEEWEPAMHAIVGEYIRGADEVPHHYYRHFMHGVQIVGYKHPDPRISKFWAEVYLRLCRDLHLNPETMEQMNKRLGDNREDWIAAGDPATIA